MTAPPFTLLQVGMHGDASGGGVDRYFWELNRSLARLATNIDVRNFFFEKRPPADHEISGHLALGRANLPIARRLYLLRRRILQTPNFNPARFVLASHFSLYALPLLSEFTELTHVIHFHGPWAEESSLHGQGKLRVFVKNLVEKLVYRTGSSFITDSRAFRDLLVSQYDVLPERVHPILPAVDTERFKPSDRQACRERLGWPRNRRIIFCVRRLVERTGIEPLVAAFAMIARRYPEVSLFVAGEGPLRGKLELQVAALGLGGQVRLLGFVPDSLLPTAYQAADISVVPSTSLEGFGFTTVESLACGTPVLVTPVGGLPEVVKPLAPSCILPGTQSDQIAEGINAYLAGELTIPAAIACVEYVHQFFTWERVVRQVMTVYENAFHFKYAD